MLVIAEDSAAAADRAADWIVRTVEATLAGGSRCRLALSGGRTPRDTYERLALRRELPWEAVDTYFADERGVPPDHPDSNYGMVRRLLFDRLPTPAPPLHRMEAERPDRDAAALDYEAILPVELDAMVLGMGLDGHTASLFPGDPALHERRRRVVPVTGGQPPLPRLTVTPGVLERARHILVVITGTDKAANVAAALEGPDRPDLLPIQLVRSGTWILDRDAAALLGAGTTGGKPR